MLRRLFIALSVLSFALVAQAASGTPSAQCRATKCTCELWQNGNCSTECNNAACGWHSGQCSCAGITPTPTEPGATAPKCEQTAIGSFCNYTCPTSYSPSPAGSYNCTSDPSKPNGASWNFVSGCYLQCKGPISTLPTNVANASCADPANHGTVCNTYTCNAPTKDNNYLAPTGASWTCLNGTWTASAGAFCAPSACSVPTNTPSTTFYCKPQANENLILNGTSCSYSCTANATGQWVPTTPNWCVNGQWTNPTPCVPSCRGDITGAPTTTATLRKGCVLTRVVGVDGTVIERWLNARNGDQCPIYCNTGLALSTSTDAAKWWWGAIGTPDGPGEPTQAPCWNSWWCNAVDNTSTPTTGLSAWQKASNTVAECFKACPVNNLASDQAINLANGADAVKLACAYTDPVTGNTYYVNTAETVANDYAAPFKTAIPHGWKCRVQCPQGYKHQGGEGPYCYDGKWLKGSRTGHGGSVASCVPVPPDDKNGAAGSQADGKNCTATGLTSYTSNFTSEGGFVELDSCPLYNNVSVLQYTHGRAFRLRCTRTSQNVLEGSSFVECVDGSWWFGGSPTGSATCKPPQTATCAAITAANVSNADPSWAGCAGYGPGQYCQLTCAPGFAPKYNYWNTSGASTDSWAWWGSGLQCTNNGGNLVWNLPLDQVCVDSCTGQQKGGWLDTTGGCPDPGIGCDYFCNADDWLNGNVVNNTNAWRDCTGVGCAYDGKQCDPPTANLTIDILKVGVQIWLHDPLPSNAWVGIYRAGETNNYRFLYATHVGNIPGMKFPADQYPTNVTLVASVGDFLWPYNGGTPAWWGGDRTNASIQAMDLEVRVFPDLTTGPNSKSLNTSLMCSNIANKCTQKFKASSRAMSVQDAHTTVVYHPLNLMQELDNRRARQMALDTYQAARAEYEAIGAKHAEWINEHAAKHRAAGVQGALNQNNAVMPLACLAETACTCDLYGNGKCDAACNNAQCGWDALDCRCLDFPENGTSATSIGPYATRVCTASEFGAGTNYANGTTNSSEWQFVIGARCVMTCPAGWTAAPVLPPEWGLNVTAGAAQTSFNSTCVPSNATSNGASWGPVWKCRQPCQGKPEDDLTIKAAIAGTIVAGSTAPCGNSSLPYNRYYGEPCTAVSCADGYTASAGVFTCTIDPDNVNDPPKWRLVGQPCIKVTVQVCNASQLTDQLANLGVVRADNNGACVATGNVTDGEICALKCNSTGSPVNGTTNQAMCSGGNWVITAQCLGPCDAGKWKVDGSENSDQLYTTDASTNGTVCPANSLPFNSGTACQLGCNESNGFRIWQSNATLSRWKCGTTETCTKNTATGNGFFTAGWSTVPLAAGQPRCYAGCQYSALTTLIASSTVKNGTLWVQHGSPVDPTQLGCAAGTVPNGQTGVPFCYRNAFVWINTKAVRITNQWGCMTPVSKTKTRTVSPVPPPAPGANCTIDALVTFNQTQATARPGSKVDDAAFGCNDYTDGSKVQGYDGWCGYPTPAKVDVFCRNGNWVWGPTCTCGRIQPGIPNIDQVATDTKCVTTAVGQICDITCMPGFVPLYEKDATNKWWLPGAVCSASGWTGIPICAPACEGWAAANSSASFANHSSPAVCDSTDPALCDWFCGRGLGPNATAGSNHLECSTPACKAKGVETQCRDPRVQVTIAPVQVRVNWAFSRDVSQTAFFAFTTDATGANWKWARNIPKDTNRGKQQYSVNLAINGNPAPDANDWQLNTNQTYNSWAHGDLTVTLFEDHSGTIAGSKGLSSFSMCANNVKDCATSTPKPAATWPRNQKCQDKGCDCSRLGDGVCDLSCNIAECGWDSGDCGCAAPNKATVRSAATWGPCSSAPAANNTGQPAYAVNATCPFTCPSGWVVRDMANPNVTVDKPVTTCLSDPWSLSGGRWQSYVCEAPCQVPPPVVDSDSQQIKWADACNSQPSGSTACTFSCLNSTWQLTKDTAAKVPSAAVLCLDGRYQEWEVDFPPKCVPVCKGSDVTLQAFPVTNANGWTCNNTSTDDLTATCSPTCASGFLPQGSVSCQLQTQTPAANNYGKWVASTSPAPVCNPIPPQAPNPPQVLATCSIAQLNALISNGNVFDPSKQCANGTLNRTNSNDDITITVGGACNWTCEPNYVKTGGDPQQQQFAICQATGSGTASWFPTDINAPRCLAPCFQPPPVDGGAHCGKVPYDAVPLGGSCNNWGCDPDFVADFCTGPNKLQCLNLECENCKYANGDLISPVANCPNACGNTTRYSSPYRRWELTTPYWQNTVMYRLPYCFRPCYAPFLVERAEAGIASCGNTTTRGNVQHGQRCQATCDAGYVRSDLADPICYDGAFRGNLNGICVKATTTQCSSGTECCRTSELTQPWNARISGDENMVPAEDGECREFWPSGSNVTFECNTAPTNGNPQYKWYTGTDNLLLGNGDTSTVATCGTDGNWWWTYNGNKISGIPKCTAQTACSAILYNPAIVPDGEGSYTQNGVRNILQVGRPMTFGSVNISGTILGVVCNATGPGEDCIMQCQPGYAPVWETENGQVKYGPICDATNDWKYVPRCAPACIASGCVQPYNYSTACDGICQDDLEDWECSGPACNNDNNCPPRKVMINIRPVTLQVEITTDKPLPNAAWIGAFRNKEGDTTGNYRWSGAQKVSTTTSGTTTYRTSVNIELDNTKPNAYTDGQLEVKLFHDVALAPGQELGSALMCEPCKVCKGFDVNTCPVIPPPAAPTAPVAPAPPSPPAAPVAPAAPGAPGAPGTTPSGPGGSPGSAAAAGSSDKEKLFLALFIVFLVTTILLAAAVVVLFLKLRAAGSAKGANYSQL